MPYHIDEENSELAFEVREGNKLVIKIKSNIFSDSLELYLIKVGDNTEPTDKNVFSSLRVLKEIENLHDTILKEINSVTSGFWELKQDSQGNEYIATKYNVLTEGGLTTYGLGEQKLGTIYDGLPIDNNTIYWEEVEGSRVLKAKGSGSGSTGLDETKLWNVLGTPGDQQIDYSHLRSAFSQFSNEFVTINTEQEITALKHFTAGLSIGSAKKKIYEKDGVLYIDSNVAITGALTMYATDGQSVSSIYDGLPIDNDTIYWETVEGSRILKAKGGSSFDENAMWSALSGSSNNQINKSHLTDALAGYATTEALNSVSNKLNDFLEGSDTDNIINKWKELEAFLSGMAETDNLAEILKTKADRSYVDSTFVTLSTKQTITGEKTFSSVLNTAAIKASGEITTPSLAASDYVTIAGIKLRKLEDGALMLEGNLALTGALTMYASNGQSFDTIYDGLPIDNDTIYWQEVDGSRVLKAREGSGSSFDKSAMWTALAGSTTEQINKSHLTTALDNYPTKTGSGASGTWSIDISGNASNADKLDDKHLQRGSNYWDRIPLVSSDGVIELGRYLDFHHTSSDSGDYSTRLQTQGKYNNIVLLPTGSGQLALTSDNAASANKLYTTRTLWGQSFNGEKNISGSLSNVGNIVPSSDNTYTLGDITRHFDGAYVRVLRNNISRDMYVSQNTANNLIFQTSGVNRVIITHNGEFQVGNSFKISEGNQTSSYAVQIRTDSGDPYISFNENGNIWYIQGYNGYLYLGSTSANSIRIDSSGNILAPGGGTYYGSDIRYKSIMHQVNLSLLDIAKAPSFVYRWNKKGMKRDRLNLGGSAQYTQSILPWAVEDNDNFLSMDYATVAYTFAVHTARHLLTYETRTDKKIKKLEREIVILKKQLKKLGYEEVRTLDDSGI